MPDLEKIERGVRLILEGLGEDLGREGLKNTPGRVARMYAEIFHGLEDDPLSVLGTLFTEEEHEEMILVKDIPLYSMCEHHLLPFYGLAHVAYIPRKGRITGLSKIARVVEILAKRPQMQERLTSQIADTLVAGLEPRGVLVVVEAEHMCMTMRGIKKPGAKTVTSAVRGLFRSNEATRAEALALIKGG
ncbi:MAG: GTP cyclohydrolase I FolE [Clostridia bacterium]|nr:GTP cyclohydrolase I FolE [Clostridia bacterium]MDH7572173.1 GTP cyclohydrolase I FolE [Clostridia bacterium]